MVRTKKKTVPPGRGSYVTDGYNKKETPFTRNVSLILGLSDGGVPRFVCQHRFLKQEKELVGVVVLRTKWSFLVHGQ